MASGTCGGERWRRRKNFENDVRRPAQTYTERRLDQRPVDQVRMRHHRVDQLFIRQRWIGKPESLERRVLLSNVTG
jgi:hypothetical protein